MRPGRTRIIPAYAGSTLRRCEKRLSATGSSPRTRGALVVPVNLGAIDGIIPAYAGSTGEEPLVLSVSQDHPRVRGEHLVRETY